MFQYTLVITTNKPIELMGLEGIEIDVEMLGGLLDGNTITIDKYYNGGDYTGSEGGYVEEIEYLLQQGDLEDVREEFGMEDADFNNFIGVHKKNIIADLVQSSQICTMTNYEIIDKVTAYINTFNNDNTLKQEIEKCKAL